MSPTLPRSFLAKKKRILEQLAVPVEQYDDLSPKGSIDEGIRDLIDEINFLEGCVSTSSCAGRFSVFLEGKKGSSSPENAALSGDDDDAERVQSTTAGVGGKGGGGRWLLVSHDPVDARSQEKGWITACGMQSIESEDGNPMMHSSETLTASLIHFKFEPMVCMFLSI